MKFIQWLLTPYTRWKEHRQYKRRLEELRKRDPYIYK
jgi:hypothetical protein